jgi:hypothetical protein
MILAGVLYALLSRLLPPQRRGGGVTAAEFASPVGSTE